MKTIETQIYQYAEKFEHAREFPTTKENEDYFEREVKSEFVYLWYYLENGTVYLTKLDDEENVLTFDEKRHIKQLFVEEIEKKYIEVKDRDNESWDEMLRDVEDTFFKRP